MSMKVKMSMITSSIFSIGPKQILDELNSFFSSARCTQSWLASTAL